MTEYAVESCKSSTAQSRTLTMRKSTRDTSLMQRSDGGCIDAIEAVVQRKKTGVGVCFLTLGAAFVGGVDDGVGVLLLVLGVMILCSVVSSNVLTGSKRPPLIKRPNGEKWRIDHFHDGEVHQRFGFASVAELRRVHTALNWPAFIRVGKGDQAKRYNVEGEQPFLYMLERDHCATKYALIEFWCGDSYNSTCEQSLAAERWLVDNHGHRLLNLDFYADRFPMYAAAISARILQNGDQVPPEGERVVGMIDRCSVRIARPQGNWAFQRLFWSVKSGYHNLAYQTFYAPDGMHMHLWGPKAGKHNDRLLLSQSGLNRQLKDLQRLPNGLLPAPHLLFHAYTDRGYENDT
jgi:hypothetical protein